MNSLLFKSVAQGSKEMVGRGQDMPDDRLGDALDQSSSIVGGEDIAFEFTGVFFDSEFLFRAHTQRE